MASHILVDSGAGRGLWPAGAAIRRRRGRQARQEL